MKISCIGGPINLEKFEHVVFIGVNLILKKGQNYWFIHCIGIINIT